MCTDLDRNDKARVCVPGSVEVVGRRQIEMYSRLIHTVDHVKGILKSEFDALDGFLAHTWAVTVTGAPKLAAMQFIEAQEKSPRHWYGGALGHIGFDGNLNTGLTLRTMRIKAGVAEIRAGATLLIDSDPVAEEQSVPAVRKRDTPIIPICSIVKRDQCLSFPYRNLRIRSATMVKPISRRETAVKVRCFIAILFITNRSCRIVCIGVRWNHSEFRGVPRGWVAGCLISSPEAPGAKTQRHALLQVRFHHEAKPDGQA
jgi:hypothetical protein